MIRAIQTIDRHISGWMDRYGITLLRVSLAIVFIWFGILKPLWLSEANQLAYRTIYWIPADIFIPILGIWEVLIGITLLIPSLTRIAVLLLLLQMPGTFLPLVLLPDVCWIDAPWVPTLEGQYIFKNLVLISAGIVIGGTVRYQRNRP